MTPILAQQAVMVLLSVALVGCGYQLREPLDLSPGQRNIYIEGGNPYGEFRTELRDTLQGGGINVVVDRAQSGIVINILEERYNRDVLSVNTNASVQEYQLDYSVRFQASDAQGNILVPNQIIRVWRDYRFDKTNLLGRDANEAVLREAMIRDAVGQLLRRVHSQLGK